MSLRRGWNLRDSGTANLLQHGSCLEPRRNSHDGNFGLQSNHAELLFFGRQRRGYSKNGNVEYDECASNATSQNNNASIFEVTQSSPPQNDMADAQVAGQYAYRGMRIPSLYPGVQW